MVPFVIGYSAVSQKQFPCLCPEKEELAPRPGLQRLLAAEDVGKGSGGVVTDLHCISSIPSPVKLSCARSQACCSVLHIVELLM